MFGKKKKIIARFQKILSRHYGGVYKRIDENRELLDLIRYEAPELLAKRPWIVGWFEAQDGFLQDLAATTTLSDIQFGVVCGRGRNPTLRLWPTIFSGKIDVFPGDRRSRLISSMTSVAPA